MFSAIGKGLLSAGKGIGQSGKGIGQGLGKGPDVLAKGITNVAGTESALGGLASSVKSAMPVIGAGLFAVGKIMDWAQTKKNKQIKKRMERSIEADFQNQMNQLIADKNFKESQIDYEAEQASESLNVQSENVLEQLTENVQNITGQQGFATSGDAMLDTDDLIDNYNRSFQKLIDTRSMNLEATNLNFAKGIGQLERQKAQRMAEASKIKTTFKMSDLLS